LLLVHSFLVVNSVLLAIVLDLVERSGNSMKKTRREIVSFQASDYVM
jgi:hypothetical protein